jgi:hypothetical protein
MFLQWYSGVLCAQNTEETVHHLFLQCEFANQCWEFIGVDIPSESDFPDSMVFLRDAVNSQFYMETIILLCWAIWTTRNAFIFNDIQPELMANRRVFQKEINLLSHRVSTRSSQAFDQWLQQFIWTLRCGCFFFVSFDVPWCPYSLGDCNLLRCKIGAFFSFNKIICRAQAPPAFSKNALAWFGWIKISLNLRTRN